MGNYTRHCALSFTFYPQNNPRRVDTLIVSRGKNCGWRGWVTRLTPSQDSPAIKSSALNHSGLRSLDFGVQKPFHIQYNGLFNNSENRPDFRCEFAPSQLCHLVLLGTLSWELTICNVRKAIVFNHPLGPPWGISTLPDAWVCPSKSRS